MPAAPTWSCSRWGFPCRRRCRRRGALLPHRFTLAARPACRRRAGGVLSVALSLGSPPPGVTRHRTSVEPGLSSPRAPAESGHPAVWHPRFGLSRRPCQSLRRRSTRAMPDTSMSAMRGGRPYGGPGRMRSRTSNSRRVPAATQWQDKRAFIILTIDPCYDIVADMRSPSLGAMNLSRAVVPLLRFLDLFQPKQRGTADVAAVPASAKPSAA